MGTRGAAKPGPLHPSLIAGGEYPFVELERHRRELQPAGVTTIHFGMGDPRAACAAWLRRRHGVGTDPERHILRANGRWFRPERVPDEVWARTALLWLNPPHDPKGSVIEPEVAGRVAALARARGFWVCSDEAYADLWFEGGEPGTLPERGLDNVLALFTLSKRSAMTGHPSGFMAGDPRLIDALRRFRPNAGVATPAFV